MPKNLPITLTYFSQLWSVVCGWINSLWASPGNTAEYGELAFIKIFRNLKIFGFIIRFPPVDHSSIQKINFDHIRRSTFIIFYQISHYNILEVFTSYIFPKIDENFTYDMLN